MALGEVADQRQAKACAAGLARGGRRPVEPIEDLPLLRRFNTDAAVRDLELRHAVGEGQGDADLP